MSTKHPPLLTPERIKKIKKSESKKCVFDSLTELLVKGQSEVTKNDIFDALINREKLGNTYIGNGIAIPRAHLNLTNPRAALLILKNGLKINSVDKIPVKLFFAILIPEKNQEKYSDIFSAISSKLTNEEVFKTFTETDNTSLLVEYLERLLTKPEEV